MAIIKVYSSYSPQGKSETNQSRFDFALLVFLQIRDLMFIVGDRSGNCAMINPDLVLMADILPSYPPSLPPKALHYLLTSLTDYCLSHGVTVRSSQLSEGNHLASHAPVTLFPSLFPRTAWEQAIQVQTTYNILYAKIANDEDWLGEIMDEWTLPRKLSNCRLVEVDDFVRQLWELYNEVKREGIVQGLFH
jgi:glutathione synthase